MPKVNLSPRRVLEFIILGIKRGNYQAAINIAQDCIDQLPEDTLFSSAEKGKKTEGETDVQKSNKQNNNSKENNTE